MHESELSQLISTLIDAQLESDRAAKLVKNNGQGLYVIEKNAGHDIERLGMEHYRLLHQAWVSPHPPADGTASSTIMAPGFVLLQPDTAGTTNTLDAIEAANSRRQEFSALYRHMRKNEPYKHRLPETLRQKLKSMNDSGILPQTPCLVPGMLVSSRQVHRQIKIMKNVQKIGIYSEQLRRREKVDAQWLRNELESMSPSRAQVIQDKINRHGNLNDLRKIVESSSHRYRLNIDYGNGVRSNKACTLPFVVVGNMPEIVPFGSRMESRAMAAERKDKRNYFPVAEELNLYGFR